MVFSFFAITISVVNGVDQREPPHPPDTSVLIPVVGAVDSHGDRPIATIVIPEGSVPERRHSAELLQGYLRRSTGVTPPIASRAGEGVALHVGRSTYVDTLGLKLETLDEDGFVLKGIDERTYVIAGPTEYGTEFAVCEFLERFVGVRWLLPSEAGTDVPRLSSIQLRTEEIRAEPSFRSRMISGLRNSEEGEWARRMRMHGRISFHHNLFRLFPPSVYAKTHTEFFPMVDGRRYLPKDDNDQAWQPNFAAKGLVAEAVRKITRHFQENRGETSYSLGVNDGILVDESPNSKAREKSRANYLGFQDISDSYFAWCNAVVEGVLHKFPDKWFGCLAYQTVAEPPTKVKINSRIVPFMTYDRLQWADSTKRNFSEELTKKWASAAEVLGWYDYVYGTCYCLPRVYPHLMADYLRFGRRHGVRMLYAEGYPNWGEGPKLYLYLKLLWDPDIDVDATLDDWYERCVGKEAASDLKGYYAIWERFWTQTIPGTEWFRGGGEYLPFSSPTYLESVNDEDLRRSRELLNACVEKAQTKEQRVRADLLLSTFEYYEASAQAYRATSAAGRRVLGDDEDVLRAIDEDVQSMEAAQRRLAHVQRYQNDPVLAVPHGWDEHPQLRGEDWCASLFWPALGRINDSPRIKKRFQELLNHPLSEVKKRAGQVLQVAEAGPGNGPISADPSFESEDSTLWNLWVARQPGTMRRVAGVSRTGKYSVLCEGVQRGGPHQRVPITPGRYLALGYALAPEGQSSTGTVTLTATMRGEDDKDLPTPSREVRPVPGVWRPISCEIDVPARVDDKPVTRLLLIAIVNGWKAGEKVYLDDIALYRLGDAR